MGVRRRAGDEPCWGFVLLWRMQPAPQAALGKKNMAVPLPARFAGGFLPLPASPGAGRCHGRAECRFQMRGIVWRRGEENPIWWKGFPPCASGLSCFCSLLLVGKAGWTKGSLWGWPCGVPPFPVGMEIKWKSRRGLGAVIDEAADTEGTAGLSSPSIPLFWVWGQG